MKKNMSIKMGFKWVKGTVPPGWRIYATDRDGYWTVPNERAAPTDYWWWREFTPKSPFPRLRWPRR